MTSWMEKPSISTDKKNYRPPHKTNDGSLVLTVSRPDSKGCAESGQSQVWQTFPTTVDENRGSQHLIRRAFIALCP
jgi:hypothetical protein